MSTRSVDPTRRAVVPKGRRWFALIERCLVWNFVFGAPARQSAGMVHLYRVPKSGVNTR